MILEQFYLGCLAQASYVIGDASSGVAAVVDPRRDVDVYLDFARERGLRIEHVLLTHFHADFLAGHLELRERCGATIYLGAAAEAEFAFTPLAEGDVVRLGEEVTVEALATPGHTPESTSYLVFDARAADPDQPLAVLTGDALFIGDVGRPDLLASKGVTKEELAGQLYDSLREKLLTLPGATLVYPAHGAGSMCGKNLSSETVSTIGDQRRQNYALQPMGKEEFVDLVGADQPPAPAYFAFDAELNRRERPTLEQSLAAGRSALALEDVLRLQNQGAQVLDARDPEAFAAGHLAGALNAGIDGKFAMWAGAVIDPGRPTVVVADPGREEEAATRLGRIGFDRVAGHLEGGHAALAGRPDLVVTLPRFDPPALRERLGAPDAPALLDVRGPGEWVDGRIEGAVHVPLPELPDRLGDVPSGEVVVYCGGGYRSVVAASLLQAAGRDDVSDLRGGYRGWTEAAASAAS